MLPTWWRRDKIALAVVDLAEDLAAAGSVAKAVDLAAKVEVDLAAKAEADLAEAEVLSVSKADRSRSTCRAKT